MVDTAEMYDNEEFIGRAIGGVRDRVFLVSKVHPSHADYRGTIRACEKSLRRLNTDYLDLYLLHWKSRYPFSETIGAMTQLQRSGKNPHVGSEQYRRTGHGGYREHTGRLCL